MMSEENFEKIKKLLNYIIENDNSKQALIFVRRFSKLEDIFSNKKDYKKWLIKAKFIALPLLKKAEIIDLLKENFLMIFFIENYDIIEKLESRMINFIVFSERDELKKDLRKVLLDNQEILTEKKLLIGDDILPATVGNWLKDYISNIGNEPADKVKQAQYLTSSDNIKKIEKQEKEKVKTLIELYEYLKLSSETPLGHEESYPMEIDGKFYDFSKGELQTCPKNILSAIDSVLGKETGGESNDIFEITDQEREQYKQEKANKLENKFSNEIEKKAIGEEVLDKVDRSHIVARKRELNALLRQYKKGSLEYKAIKDELDKLE
ncbi:MAG: hypothetical protein GWO87_01175 [Xanthomonadaceae bacterium]|nr:hypothetical protein [Rhodospirillaceae bacterium]NIA17787.1 hypothetical protein [Xanthomonadaceae bacterium]